MSQPTTVPAAAVVQAPALLQAHIDVQSLIVELSAIVRQIPNFQSLRSDMSLCQHLLTIVRAKVPTWTDAKLARVVGEVLKTTFGLSEADQLALQSQIAYILANGLSELPKPVKTVFKRVKSFFLKAKPTA